MTTILTTHLLCTKNIKSVRRQLDVLLSFDPTFTDIKNEYSKLEEADDLGYINNYYFLQDKLYFYYAKRDRELDEGLEKVYHSDSEGECIQFAIESLIEYLQRHTEDRLDYSVKILDNVVSVVITAHIFD